MEDNYKKWLGRQGEELAALFLQRQGMKILCRNYTIRGGELDIIALDGQTYVFCEVKTRTSQKFGAGVEAIDRKKQQALLRTAQVYAAKQGILEKPMRFDVVDILLGKDGKHKLSYIKNAELCI